MTAPRAIVLGSNLTHSRTAIASASIFDAHDAGGGTGENQLRFEGYYGRLLFVE